MSRAERRKEAAASARAPASDAGSLVAKIRRAKLPGTPAPLAERARKALIAYVESASAHVMPFSEIVARLADGRAAMTLSEVEAREIETRRSNAAAPLGTAGTVPMACAAGCAFCCILNGKDGGTITAREAERLHGALAPLAGAPDGRMWHKRACPALDPETRLCRAYDARPSICRSFHSTDADACEANANGAPTPGARLSGAHLLYLAAHGLARAGLAGRTRVSTFSLFDVAAGAVAGQPLAASLSAARHAPGELDAERRRTGRAMEERRSAPGD